MAIAMLITRTLGLAARATRLAPAHTDEAAELESVSA
jgi:hypothetical protein